MDKLKITVKIYGQLVAALDEYADVDSYASDLGLSDMWGDDPEADIPAERITALQRYWALAHASLRDILADNGISARRLARRFGIPERTTSNWTLPATSKNYHQCPLYTKLMIVECLGLLPFDIT